MFKESVCVCVCVCVCAWMHLRGGAMAIQILAKQQNHIINILHATAVSGSCTKSIESL